MFSKNLKFYRLRKQMSKKELADRANVTSMAITNYEKGDRKPNMEILQALASALMSASPISWLSAMKT